MGSNDQILIAAGAVSENGRLQNMDIDKAAGFEVLPEFERF